MVVVLTQTVVILGGKLKLPIELVSEDRVHLSLGRVSFWFIFFTAFYFWLFLKVDTPPNFDSAFKTILGYNLVTKAITVYKETKEGTTSAGE